MTSLSHLTAEELADMAIQHAGTLGAIDEDIDAIEAVLRECAARLRGRAGEPDAKMIAALSAIRPEISEADIRFIWNALQPLPAPLAAALAGISSPWPTDGAAETERRSAYLTASPIAPPETGQSGST